MSESDLEILDTNIIDINPVPNRSGGRKRWLLALTLLVILAISASTGIGVYIDSLWFDSLGFGSRFWSVFGLGWGMFAVFGTLTFAILRSGFYAIGKIFGIDKMTVRRVYINKEPVNIDVSRIVRLFGWAIAILFGIGYGLALSGDWQTWTLYLHQVPTSSTDPIFGNSLAFYLFTYPVLNIVSSWLMTLFVVLLVATAIGTAASVLPDSLPVDGKPMSFSGFGKSAYIAVSAALAGLLLVGASRVMLARYTYLWTDHSSFSGVTYSEANYLIPGLTLVAVAMVIGACLMAINAFTQKGVRLIVAGLGIPLAAYIVAAVIIPLYVQNFVVKPNELVRETPYIEHNIAGTRAGFDIDNVEARDYAADISPTAFNLADNRSTLANIRLWDWRALQDTLRQIQELRTYYDFPDVDVDRYKINGEMRQVMIATRELDVNKLPEQSRNWINERLVYTHGYGVTMNPVNEFTTEGKPRFLLSNMPVESSADIKVTRPEIYFGEITNTNVYVKTKQLEFDHPQGENNNYSNYEGDGGFAVGSGLRRFCVAWATDDLAKLPFSDDVTADSRVLLHRNISDRVRRIAPFLKLDTDPYIVINDDGHLFWMLDAYTSTNRYPYSRHFDVNGQNVNYLRNSVKVTINAYSGAVNYYVFDEKDPMIGAWRAAFPALFKSASEMPPGLRVHVRYPETYIKTQADVFGLYHTTAAKTFFGREDIWSIAREAASSGGGKSPQQQTKPFDAYQVLMPLPGEEAKPEFVQVLPFTPANRNNMIAWMAGRSDGDAYGQLLVYMFPASRVIDGPAQIDARIDQDANLSGQITLWSQQGSKVKRGDLIVMPIGTGLLFVEPIYLQADRSPMPELRLVVLATQERLVYAQNFEAALKLLLGESSVEAPKEKAAANPGENPASSSDELIKRASAIFTDYQRLTAEGKLGEAGQKLDELKKILSVAQPAQK